MTEEETGFATPTFSEGRWAGYCAEASAMSR